MTGSPDAAALHHEIVQLARLLDACCCDPWWLIGSAALVLSDVDAASPGDIDVLASRRDAEAFIETQRDRVDASYRPLDDGRFRSDFARFDFSPLPVEVMGGLEVRRNGDWIAVTVEEDAMIDCDGTVVRVPTRCEQIRLFELFGRDKDLAKAQALRARIAQEAAHAAFG